MSTETAVVTARERMVVHDDGPLAHLFDTARFEHMQRIAGAMAVATFTPKHLCGKTREETIGNCLRVANQAVRWGMDPFAVMDETYVVGGKLGYQGKLVSAVVNARAGLIGRLSFSFSGEGDKRTIVVSGTFEGESEPRTIELSVGQAKTQNDMWRKDPDQKLVYSGVIKWARRHCPEVILGVVTDDDLERMAHGNTVTEPGVEPVGIPLNKRVGTAEPLHIASEPESPAESSGVIDVDPEPPVDQGEIDETFVDAIREQANGIPAKTGINKLIRDIKADLTLTAATREEAVMVCEVRLAELDGAT